MEMQEQSILNEMMCDEIHEIEDNNEQQDYRGPMTRSRAKTLETIETSMGENQDQNEEVSQEGLPILYTLRSMQGGPVYRYFSTESSYVRLNVIPWLCSGIHCVS